MAVNIEALSLAYFSNSEPIPYSLKKGESVLIYPILLKDAPLYDWAIDILEYNKNEINDINIIQMSYLDYINEYIFKQYKVEDESSPIYKLSTIFKLCLNEDYIAIEKDKGKTCVVICEKDGTIKKIINHKEFDDISKIILHQNNANYDDRYISPEVRELMQEYYKVKYSNISSPSLERKKAFVCSKTGKNFSELGKLTYREFELIYSACVDSEIYMATKITEASYKYEVKEQTKHPLFDTKKDPYAELFEDTSILSGKGINGAEQLNNINFSNQ